ncbi:hypothetical protein ACFL06_00305 [Patescibacteria group bacterium]
MKHYKKIFILCLFVFFLTGSFALAQHTDLEYPDITGSKPPSSVKTFLPEYIKYVFNISLVIAGLVAFMSMIFGGFRYLSSAGSPTTMSDARSQIGAGVLGLFLLLISYLLLTSINPQLVILKTGDITAERGVILYTQPGCLGENNPTGTDGDDYQRYTKSTSSLLDLREQEENPSPEPIRSIFFYNGNEDLEVTLYPGVDYWTGGANPQKFDTHKKGTCCPGPNCPDHLNIITGADSIKLNWKIPGIYLYAGDNCKGTPEFPDPFVFVGNTDFGYLNFHDQAKSMKIYPKTEKKLTWINPPAGVCTNPFNFPGLCQDAPQCCEEKTTIIERLGVILHEHSNFQGDAEVYLGGSEDTTLSYGEEVANCINLEEGDSQCPNDSITTPYCQEHVNKNNDPKVSSVSIFKQKLLTDMTSGDGVSVYSNYDWNEEDDPGEDNVFCGPFKPSIEPKWVDLNTSSDGDSTSGTLHGNSANGCRYILGLERGSSIRVDGSYIAVLFRESGRAEVFFPPGDVRLKDNHIGNDKARYLLVIPIAR